MHIFENEPDDTAEEDEQFSIAIDDSLLTEALAAVEKRMGGDKDVGDLDIGPFDLDALAAVENELAIEIEEDESVPDVDQASASIEARLRAMEAEQEAGWDNPRAALAARLAELEERIGRALEVESDPDYRTTIQRESDYLRPMADALRAELDA